MPTSANPEDDGLRAEIKFRLLPTHKAALLALAMVESRVSGRRCKLSDMGRKAIKEFIERHGKAPTMEISTATAASAQTTDKDTLFFPTEIAVIIGMSGSEINALKKRGCNFLGRKTTIRWVREWIKKEAGGE